MGGGMLTIGVVISSIAQIQQEAENNQQSGAPANSVPLRTPDSSGIALSSMHSVVAAPLLAGGAAADEEKNAVGNAETSSAVVPQRDGVTLSMASGVFTVVAHTTDQQQHAIASPSWVLMPQLHLEDNASARLTEEQWSEFLSHVSNDIVPRAQEQL